MHDNPEESDVEREEVCQGVSEKKWKTSSEETTEMTALWCDGDGEFSACATP